MVSLALIGRGVVDGLANFVSGIGTGKDKASQYVYTYSPLDQRTIEAAYATDWLARKIIDVLPQDMTREWRVWQWDKASDCYELEKTLKVRTKVRRALKLARLYGGSAILIGDGSDRPEKPLDVERIGKGDLKYLHVFSRHQLSNDRERVKDLKNPDYGLPEFYRIGAQGYSSGRRDLDQVLIHRSRFVFFEGAEPPDSIRDQNSGWGLPLYQSILEAVTAANAAAKNAASLVEEAKLDIITMPDLGSVLATDEGAKRLTERFTLANVLKSTVNTLLLGEGETFERKQISFAGLVDLMNANMQIASGAADVPITRLLGQSPAGLNATGESDLRNYYDHVRSLQTTDLSELLDTLDEALIRSVAGRRPDEAMYEWELFAAGDRRGESQECPSEGANHPNLSQPGSVYGPGTAPGGGGPAHRGWNLSDPRPVPVERRRARASRAGGAPGRDRQAAETAGNADGSGRSAERGKRGTTATGRREGRGGAVAGPQPFRS